METTPKNPAFKLPEPLIIPGIMEFIRAEKERISLEISEMSVEERNAYDERRRKEFLAAYPNAKPAGYSATSCR